MSESATDSVECPQAQGNVLPARSITRLPLPNPFSPRASCQFMMACSRRVFLVIVALSATIYGSSIVALGIWGATTQWANARSANGIETEVLREYTFAEVWSDWHQTEAISPAVSIFAVAVSALFALALFATWVLFPIAYRGGSVWGAFGRAFRGVVAGFACFWLMSLAVGALGVTAANVDDQTGNDDHFAGVMFLGLICLCLFLRWLARAAHEVAEPNWPVSLAPRCEDCGYDLSHRAADGRCPECGGDIDRSLTPGARRTGLPWQNKASWSKWIETTISLIFTPTRAYGKLLLRVKDQTARRFATRQYPAAAGAGALLIAMCVLSQRRVDVAIVFVPMCVGMLAGIAGWVVHRFVGAFVTGWWIIQGTLPDARWASVLIAYEASFMWVLCFFNSLLFASVFLFDHWMTDLMKTTGILYTGPLIEPAAFLGGNLLLMCLWFVRHDRAAKAVRWSNF